MKSMVERNKKPIAVYRPYEPSTHSIINWVAEDPENAPRVGAGFIVLGGAILILAAILSS